MTNGLIIQARMTSKRFPGKSMALLAGKPVLQHVIERCRRVPFIEKLVVAMPIGKASAPMGALCEEMGVDTFYGPEDDVLKRYYLCATQFDMSVIMRITGDCPFIDPIICGEVLSLLKAHDLDYCSNVHGKRTYPKGLDCEVFSYDCLEAADIKSQSAYNREHVTPWMQTRGGINRMCLQQKIDVSSENWCVDVPEDIPRLETMLAAAEQRLADSGLRPSGAPTSPSVH